MTTVRSKKAADELSEDERKLVEPFSPTFVYPIFGDEETIFGYKGLNIDVRGASDLQGALAQTR